MSIPLTRRQVAVLRVLCPQHIDNHSGWWSALEVGYVLDKPRWEIIGEMHELARRRLVARGRHAEGQFGHWSITERGLQELAAASQLRLAT